MSQSSGADLNTVDVREARTWLCPACGSGMYPASLLKGYDKIGLTSVQRSVYLIP